MRMQCADNDRQHSMWLQKTTREIPSTSILAFQRYIEPQMSVPGYSLHFSWEDSIEWLINFRIVFD